MTATQHTAEQRSILGEFRETVRFRPFIAHTWRRELRTQYNRSLLGWVWSVLNPLTTLLIYGTVFGLILGANDSVSVGANDLKSFAHYLISGLVIWNVFSITSTDVMHAFAQSIHLRHRVYFPPAAPLMARALTSVTTNGVELAVLVVAYAAYGNVGWSFLALIPTLVLTAIFGLGVGLLLSVPNIRFRDVGYLYTVFLRLFFYLTPLVYPAELVKDKDLWGLDLEVALKLNPVTHFVDAARRCTYVLEMPSGKLWLIMVGCAVVSFAVGWAAFARFAPNASEGA